jgi:competence protein ComEA
MKINMEPIKNWFGFTRRERRSTFILLLIVVLIISIRYAKPEKNIDIEDITATIAGPGNFSGLSEGDNPLSSQAFQFDPNKASLDTLLRLGLTTKEANTLINYRNNGGKFRQPVDLKKVYGIDENKAEKLIPYIKFKTGPPIKAKVATSKQVTSLVDINKSDSAAFEKLPGIGPVLSGRIIKYRRLLGGFSSVDQLKEVYGLPVETFDLIKGRVIADSSAVLKININSAGYKELSRLPYFDKYEITAILKYRELKGRVNSITDLTENKLLTAEKAVKVRPYLKFE